MYKVFDNKYFFYDKKDNLEYTEPFIDIWCKYLKREKAQNTIKSYALSVHKFWIFCLYFPPERDEDFFDYLIRYKETIKNKGFVVKKNTFSVTDIDSVYTAYTFKSKKNIINDFIAIKSFYSFIVDKRLNSRFNLVPNNIVYCMYGDSNKLNFKKLDAKNKYNKGSSYGLKASEEMRYAIAERISVLDTIIKTIKISKNYKVDNSEIFPLVAFDALLDVANTRNRLYYLICGGASARASQSLCLTIFDIDAKNKKVYLVDPLSNKDNSFFKEPRNKLLGQYNIDFNLKPYNKIGFKYDIPTENSQDRSLTFLPSYEEQFFKTYYEWNRHMDKNYPMVFQVTDDTGTHIPTYKSMYTAFKRDIEKVKKKYPYLKEVLGKFNNGIHGLRHMYGCAFADYVYYINLPENKKLRDTIAWDFSPEESRQIIKNAMGHSSETANKIYFKQSRFVFLDIQDRFKNRQDLIMHEMKKIQKHTLLMESI